MNRLLVGIAGVWIIAQVVKGGALERLGIISTAATPATPKVVPNYGPAPGSNAGGTGAASPWAPDPSAPGNVTPPPANVPGSIF